MWNHYRFEELAALAAAGQISGRELEEFLDHAQYCSQCKDTFSSFAQLHEQDLPLVGQKSFFTAATPVPSGMTERFLERARESGIKLAEEGATAHSHWEFSRFSGWGNYQKAFLAALLVVVLAGGIAHYRYRSLISSSQRVSAQVAASRNLKGEGQAQHDQDDALRNQVKDLTAANQQLSEQLAYLKQENERETTAVSDLRSKLSDAESANQNWQSDFSRHLAEEEASIRQKDDQLLKARMELQRAQDSSAQNEVDVVALRTKIQDLAEQVRMQREATEREHELISADRDIRDLMGARNLHIVDVIDADASGKETRVFGRVFYTEGKSLIFYAYDLSENKLKDASYSFQVWGQKGAGSVQKLGALVQDDQHQRRWVLKVNNPVVLRNISNVFVTIGPAHGGREPQGKQLLYAYLDMKPNHP
jgi:hypothetical protein